uniref:DB domain-containing protein n=1 Tax=Rhabditophanes sp. KR3021 TaxID=114890 RepID=A0AC35TYG6_9BILA
MKRRNSILLTAIVIGILLLLPRPGAADNTDDSNEKDCNKEKTGLLQCVAKCAKDNGCTGVDCLLKHKNIIACVLKCVAAIDCTKEDDSHEKDCKDGKASLLKAVVENPKIFCLQEFGFNYNDVCFCGTYKWSL